MKLMRLVGDGLLRRTRLLIRHLQEQQKRQLLK
jgi:hypothetical protein